MKKELRCWLFILLLQLTWIPFYICGPEPEHDPPVEVIEEEGELIRWKQEDTYEDELLDVSVEPLELDEVKEWELQSLGVFMLTAYCPCTECSNDYGTQTATGAIATEGRTVAVDPKVIPYGTVLVINGHEYVAEDCGAAIKGNDIDIYFESHEEAMEFGVQYAEVFVR